MCVHSDKRGKRVVETGTGVEVLGKEQKVRPCFIKRNMVKNIFAKLNVTSSRKQTALNVTGGEGHHVSVPAQMLKPDEATVL